MTIEEVVCPFCKEADFDLIGLEIHLERGWCEVFGTLRKPKQDETLTLKTDLSVRIDLIFKEEKRPMSAVDLTKELRKRGWMPEMWTVIDVADFLRDWYGGGRT